MMDDQKRSHSQQGQLNDCMCFSLILLVKLQGICKNYLMLEINLYREKCLMTANIVIISQKCMQLSAITKALEITYK